MGLFDWLGPLNAGSGKRRGWDALPAIPEQKAYSWTQNDHGAALTVNTLVHGPGASDLMGGWRGNDANSAVYACLQAICSAYVEAPLVVYKQINPKDREPQFDSPLQKLLDNPNPAIDLLEILWWVQWAKHVDGNAYLRKLRSGNEETGNVVELWPISPTRIEPKTTRDSGDFISFYRYHIRPGKHEDISVDNMVHFRMGIDDRDMRVGCSPLKRLVREVSSDDSATRFADALLKNYAVPGLVVQTPAGTTMTPDEATELKAKVAAAYGGENAGRVGVLTAGATMHAMGWSPEQLDMKALHQVPEERISAVLRCPAIVAGLGAGLARSTFSNYAEANQAFIEQTILALYRVDDKKLTHSLRPDFTSDGKISIAHDITQMRALQDDEDKKATRLSVYVGAGILDTDEARAEIGREPRPEPAALPAPTPLRALPAPADVAPAKSALHHESGPSIHDDRIRARLACEPGETKALSDDELLARYEAGLATLADDMAEELMGAFEDMVDVVAGRAMAHLKGHATGEVKADAISGLVTISDHADARRLLKSYILKTMRQAAADLAPLTGGTAVRITRASAAYKSAVASMEERLPGMVETTGKDFSRLIARLERRPGSVPLADVQAALSEYIAESYPSRAAAIAATEGGYAHATGVVEVARRSGLASSFHVSDGDGDSACMARNGTTATLEEAAGIGLLHPHCRLRIIPIVEAAA